MLLVWKRLYFDVSSQPLQILPLQEKMVSQNIRTYQDHLQTHIKEVASKLRSVEPERFLSIVDHIRSIGCTAVDYQKADMMMRVGQIRL